MSLVSGILGVVAVGGMLDLVVRRHVKDRFANFFFSDRKDIGSLSFRRTLEKFESIFCSAKGRLLFRRSVLLSLLSFLVVLTTLSIVLGINPLTLTPTRDKVIGLSAIFVFNLIGDYLSLLQSYFLLRCVRRSRGLIVFAALLLDIILTFLVWAFAISIIFWFLASFSAEVQEAWSDPKTILWHVCHQATAALVMFQNSEHLYTSNCLGFVTPPNTFEIHSFERFFLTVSAGTTYATSGWLACAFLLKTAGSSLALLFPPFSKAVSRYVDPWAAPFTVVLIYIYVYLSCVFFFAGYMAGLTTTPSLGLS